MTRWFAVLSHPFVVLNLLLACQLGVFLYTTIRPYQIVPAGRTYTILGKNFYYPSMIRQARDGAWGIQDTHTTRPTPRVYAQLFFVALGKIAALLKLDPIAMYQLARIGGAVALFWAAYWLITQILPRSLHVAAILLTVGMESGPLLPKLWPPATLVPGWDAQILLERRFGLPHHTFGEALGLVALGLYAQALTHPTPKRLVTLLVCTLAATLTLPPYIVLFGGMFVGTSLVWTLVNKKIHRTVAPALVMTAAIAVVALFTKHEFARGIPWTSWTPAEKSWMTNETVIISYLSTLSLLVPGLIAWLIALPGHWSRTSSQTKLWIVTLTSWLVAPFILIPLTQASWFPFANFRLVDGYGFIPAGILATLGIFSLTQSLKNAQLRQTIRTMLIGATVGLSLLCSIVFTKQYLANQTNFWSNIYPTTGTWSAVVYMDKLPAGSGVMVREYMGELLPAFGPVRSFIGGAHGFPDWPERQGLTRQFFSGKLSDTAALQILTQNDIRYVFWGPDEKQFTQTAVLYPQLLTPVFQSQDTTIFRVQGL